MFQLDNIFPSPSMITSAEEKTLYNLNEILFAIVQLQDTQIEANRQIIERLDELTAEVKKANKKPATAKKG